MAETANVVQAVRTTSAYKLRPSSVGIEAFYRARLGERFRVTPNAEGAFFDFALPQIMAVYADHLADDTVHTAADVTNVVNEVNVDAPIFNRAMGEYAAAIGITAWNLRQIERNDAWNDAVNLLAYLYNFMNLLNAVKAAYEAHRIDVGVHAGADAVNVITAADVAIPTPDGVVPSLQYNQGFSKFLVEIERTEPALIKGRIGQWFSRVATLAKDVTDKYNAHRVQSGVHVVDDNTNIMPVLPTV